jgi:hypothetical protein
MKNNQLTAEYIWSYNQLKLQALNFDFCAFCAFLWLNQYSIADKKET